MGRRYDTVSLLTDYGLTDEFVGVVKSVIRDIAPHVVTIDLTHEVPAFDVRAGGLALARCIPYVASGIVVAVVDPGVATDRAAVAIEVAQGEGVLIGPDNGLLAPAVALTGGAERAVALTNPEYQLPAPGRTFAGRDVFAPGRRAPGERRRPHGPRHAPRPRPPHARGRAADPCRGRRGRRRGALGRSVRQRAAERRSRRDRRRSATGSRCGSAARDVSLAESMRSRRSAPASSASSSTRTDCSRCVSISAPPRTSCRSRRAARFASRRPTTGKARVAHR